MTVFTFLLIGLVILAFYHDVRYGIIPNWLTLTGCAMGLLVHLMMASWSGFLLALYGAVGSFGIVFLFYLFKAVGAGDVKLFGAIGAIGGFPVAMNTLFYAVLFAAVIAGLILMFKQKVVHRIVYPLVMLVTVNARNLLYQWKSQALNDDSKLEDGLHRFPFMLAVAPAIIIVNLFGQLGVM